MASRFDTVLDRSELSTMKWEAEWAKAGSRDVLCYGTADMDFRSPEPVLQALRTVIDRGHLGYPYIRPSFYEAVGGWLERSAGWKIDAANEIACNVSIYTSVWNLLDALTVPGDEVIIQTPVHFCFREMIEVNGRKAVSNPLICPDGRYTMDFEQLERCFTERTKIVWLCNPHNPVGRAWSRAELERVAEICKKHDVWIVSDDVYCGLLYEGTQYVPVASVSEDAAMRTVTCYSPSKTYNTTGVKFSFIVAQNPELMAKYKQSLHRLDLDYGINALGLAVAEAAYSQCDGWTQELMAYVQENHAMLCRAAEQMPKVRVCKAEATYFAWMDWRETGLDDEGLRRMLREAGLVMESGAELGPGGSGWLRMNLACPNSVLQAGLARLKTAYDNDV